MSNNQRMAHLGEQTYQVVRFKLKGRRHIIKTHLTLEEAQRHCEDDSTHGPGWFDGYEKE